MKTVARKSLAFTLVCVMALTACSSAWLSDFSKYVQLAAPAIINIIDIVAIARGTAVDQGMIAKVNADAAALSQLADDYAKASAAAQPGIMPQLMAAFTQFQTDANTIFQVAQVKDPAKQALIQNLVSLAQNTISQIAALIPQAKSGKVAAKLTLPPSDFVKQYNAILDKGVGDQAFDKALKAHNLHIYSKALRVLSFGRLQ